MGREAQGTSPLKGHLLGWKQAAHKADVLLAQASREKKKKPKAKAKTQPLLGRTEAFILKGEGRHG